MQGNAKRQNVLFHAHRDIHVSCVQRRGPRQAIGHLLPEHSRRRNPTLLRDLVPVDIALLHENAPFGPPKRPPGTSGGDFTPVAHFHRFLRVPTGKLFGCAEEEVDVLAFAGHPVQCRVEVDEGSESFRLESSRTFIIYPPSSPWPGGM